MRFISKRALLALVAVLALSAVAVSSASAALPEFAQKQGSFTTRTGPLAIHSETLSIDCGRGTSKGSVTGAKTLVARFIFTSCTNPTNGLTCKSNGAQAGEVKTEELKSTLAYTSKANKEVGIVLNQRESKSFKIPLFTSLDCGNYTGGIRGGVIASVLPVNQEKRIFTLELQTSNGRQKISEYENESGEKFTELPEINFGAGYFAGTLSGAIEFEFEKANMIKA